MFFSGPALRRDLGSHNQIPLPLQILNTRERALHILQHVLSWWLRRDATSRWAGEKSFTGFSVLHIPTRCANRNLILFVWNGAFEQRSGRASLELSRIVLRVAGHLPTQTIYHSTLSLVAAKT
jgi:hypothetical protein